MMNRSLKFQQKSMDRHGGPHFQSAVPRWRRWLWRFRIRRIRPAVEVESPRALAVAMFHCKATPVVLSSQGFPDISEVGCFPRHCLLGSFLG